MMLASAACHYGIDDYATKIVANIAFYFQNRKVEFAKFDI